MNKEESLEGSTGSALVDKTGAEGRKDTQDETGQETHPKDASDLEKNTKSVSDTPDEEAMVEGAADDTVTEERELSPSTADDEHEGNNYENQVKGAEVGGDESREAEGEPREHAETVRDKRRESVKEIHGGSKESDKKTGVEGKATRSWKVKHMVTGIAAVLLLVLALFGLSICIKKPNPVSEKAKKVSSGQQAGKSEAIPQKRSYKLERPNPIDQHIGKIDGLIGRLRKKEKAIADLKAQYQAGIDEIENEILKNIRARKLNSYQDALKEKPIELCLHTIKRRQIYIQQLDQLLEQIVRDSEELRYQKRQAEIDALMIDVMESMDVKKLLKRLDIIIQQHLHDEDKLTMHTEDVRPQSLETVWEEIYQKRQRSGEKKIYLSEVEELNREIWQEICDGRFARKHELTALSPEVAECLSKWKGKDLFLGKLTELSPEAAKCLSKWKGRWLALNGLSRLSPEAARYLSQWKGNRLSLNGLNEVSPEVTAYLYQWEGEELELIGLKSISQWKKSGKKVHLRSQL